MSYLTRFTNRSATQREQLCADQIAQLGGRIRLAGRPLDAAAPVPDPRLGGRIVLRRRARADRARTRRRWTSCIAEDGVRTVAEIVAVAEAGRAAKNDPAVFALARCAAAPRRRDPPGGGGRAAEGVPHVDAPVPVRHVRAGVARLGPLAAACRRRVVRRTAGRRAGLPGGQVPPARRRHPPRRAAAGPPGRGGDSAGNPTLDVSPEQARLFEWIVRGGDADGLPRMVEGFTRAQEAATSARESAELVREYGLPREARPPGAPDRAGGLGGAARAHADDGDDPKPGDHDPHRADRPGIGCRGGGLPRAARRRAHPRSPCPPDRAADRAAHLRLRAWPARHAVVDAGDAHRRRARRGVLPGVRQRRADRQAAAAGARRLGVDGWRRSAGCRA